MRETEGGGQRKGKGGHEGRWVFTACPPHIVPSLLSVSLPTSGHGGRDDVRQGRVFTTTVREELMYTTDDTGKTNAR